MPGLTARLARAAAVVAAVGALAACGEPPSQQQSSAPPPEVTVATPLAHEIIDWDGFVGQFEAVERVELRPRVSGYVRAVHFEDGAHVEAGEPMFTIDARPFEAALEEARGRAAAATAQLENAQTELERARGLVDAQAVSREEVEGLEARVRSARADLVAAEAAVQARALNVEFTEVVAPVSGRASQREVDSGNAVQADNTVLTTIVSMDPIHFEFEASEALYLKYQRRTASRDVESRPAVRIRLQDETKHRWDGRLDFMDNALDASSGTIRGRAVVPNPDGFLRPGMFGHLELQASSEYEALLVPDTAIATLGAQRIVYVVNGEGVVAARDVTLGPLEGELRVIRSGLSADDRVIVDGQQRAQPGQPVQASTSTIAPPDEDAETVADDAASAGGSAGGGESAGAGDGPGAGDGAPAAR